ncbi:hypothetical protein S245_039621, partial [Arachis hypogaea]
QSSFTVSDPHPKFFPNAIPMNNGKYRLYAVRRGRIPRIYTSWEDYKEQVNGFKDAEFKGFCLLRDAQHWLGVVDPPLTLPPPPELDSGVHPLTGLFEQPFSLSKHFNSMHVGPTLGESSQKAFVPCSQIPQGPNIVPETSLTHGELLHSYWVTLQSQQRDVNWIVEGGFSSDEQTTRQTRRSKCWERCYLWWGRKSKTTTTGSWQP